MDKKIRLAAVKERTPRLIEALTAVWEHSVRATHHFLSESEILRIRAYVPQAVGGVAQLVAAENQAGEPVGFMGVENGRLEMLFLAPEARGCGLGGRLLRCGIEQYGVREVTVNEQNPQAVDFYAHFGFRTYRRTERDEEGGPYPLLYMRLPSDCP
ncbi:MAG: GNAT family N-acetyltransferase [Oscillospiraceae bacterium]